MELANAQSVGINLHMPSMILQSLFPGLEKETLNNHREILSDNAV